MKTELFKIFGDRTARHLAFWIVWVFSFTFIQSFGESMSHYVAWFSYYMVTLPIFVVHTYLVVYWLLPVFARKGRYVLMVLLFVALLVVFSVIELIVSNEFIFKWFPTGTELIGNYLSPGHVLVSGLGNLYIVMVFLAGRTIRQTYLAMEKRQRYAISRLEKEYDRVNTRMQPGLLLFSMDRLYELAKEKSQEVTPAIAAVSDLMNELIVVSELERHSAEDEIRLVRKLIRLYDTFHFRVREIGVSSTMDLTRIPLKPLLIFIILEEVIRNGYGIDPPSLSLVFTQNGENLTIVTDCSGGSCLSRMKERQSALEKRLRYAYGDLYSFDFALQAERYTVRITQSKKEE